MYSIYNDETLEKLINTVQCIHNSTLSHEKPFAGQQSSLTLKSLCKCIRLTALFNKFTTLLQNSIGQIHFII